MGSKKEATEHFTSVLTQTAVSKSKKHSSKCPDCGSRMGRRKVIECWDQKGNPIQIAEDWYCPKCKVRWLPEKLEPKPMSLVDISVRRKPVRKLKRK